MRDGVRWARLEPERGVEPLTYALRVRCSATELLRRDGESTERPLRYRHSDRRDVGTIVISAGFRDDVASMSTEVLGDVRRVMVGTDRSETAERAVGWAASFAERFGADLYVVQVVVPSNPATTEHGAAERSRADAAQDELRTHVHRHRRRPRPRRRRRSTTTPRWRSSAPPRTRRSTSSSSATRGWRDARSSCSATSRTGSATTRAAP